MQTKDIESFVKREPFKPFRLNLDDGRVIAVKHREAIAYFPGGRTVVVMQPDGFTDHIDLLHVVSIDYRPVGNGKRKKSA